MMKTGTIGSLEQLLAIYQKSPVVRQLEDQCSLILASVLSVHQACGLVMWDHI